MATVGVSGVTYLVGIPLHRSLATPRLSHVLFLSPVHSKGLTSCLHGEEGIWVFVKGVGCIASVPVVSNSLDPEERRKTHSK
jgi:hypothetical protein